MVNRKTSKKGITIIVDVLLLTTSMLLLAGLWVYITDIRYDNSLKTNAIDNNFKLIAMGLVKASRDVPICTSVSLDIPSGYRIHLYQTKKDTIMSIENWGGGVLDKNNMDYLADIMEKPPFSDIVKQNSYSYNGSSRWFFNISLKGLTLTENLSLTGRDSDIVICSQNTGSNSNVEISFKR